MELDPRLVKLCLLLLDTENVPTLSRAVRVQIVTILHAQAKLIMEQDIPVLTQVIEFGPDITPPTRQSSMGTETNNKLL